MNLDYEIEKYESELAYYETLSDSNDPFNLSQRYWKERIAECRVFVAWLKDYKRLLEAEKNWRKSLEAEIAKKDEEIKALKAELDKPITWGDFTRAVCFSGLSEINQAVADWEKRREKGEQMPVKVDKRITEDKLDKAISEVSYTLDSLMLLRQIRQTGDCNVCKNRKCGYMPKPGQLVRYNCPFYKSENEVSK